MPLSVFITSSCDTISKEGAWGYRIVGDQKELYKQKISHLSLNTTAQAEILKAFRDLLREDFISEPFLIIKLSNTYLLDMFDKGWINTWANNNWKTVAANNDIIKELYTLMVERKSQNWNFEYVKMCKGDESMKHLSKVVGAQRKTNG